MKKIIKYLWIFFATLTSYTLGHIINFILVSISLILGILGFHKGVLFFVFIWSRILFLLCGKTIQIKGRENIEKNKNYLIVANHSSLFDILALMQVFPDIAWVGAKRYKKIPVFGQLLKFINYITIDRKSLIGSKKAIDEAVQTAFKNKSIGFFPEGTRSLDGEIHKFKRGFVYILKHSNLDLLPLTLNGFYQFKPKKRFYLDPTSKLEIIIHKPLKNKELSKLDDLEIMEKVYNIIKSSHRK